ncbi:hypothetical protein [Vibrio gallaecicus]|nr:hypothetical protein [Vibrio gallaecicus]MDN3617654.1 hypothetical protein [Vibrio gallaecicus]
MSVLLLVKERSLANTDRGKIDRANNTALIALFLYILLLLRAGVNH